jgi:hypothetical protein
MPVELMSVHQISVYKMPVDEMSVDQMSVDKILPLRPKMENKILQISLLSL